MLRRGGQWRQNVQKGREGQYSEIEIKENQKELRSVFDKQIAAPRFFSVTLQTSTVRYTGSLGMTSYQNWLFWCPTVIGLWLGAYVSLRTGNYAPSVYCHAVMLIYFRSCRSLGGTHLEKHGGKMARAMRMGCEHLTNRCKKQFIQSDDRLQTNGICSLYVWFGIP